MDNEYIINLYDIYERLLTEKQSEYFRDYYFENLSFAEIAENNEVSKNAVHKQIKEVEKKLENYEECLKILEKNKKILSLVKDKELKRKIEEIL